MQSANYLTSKSRWC